MPKGVYTRTAWHKEIIRKSIIGRKQSKETINKRVAKIKKLYETGNTKMGFQKGSPYGVRFFKGQVSWNKGKIGEKSHMWKGGVSFEPYSYEFSKQLKDRVRVRDNFRCQLCYLPELECRKPNSHCIHHIDYNKKNCNLENLMLLCHKCHSYTNFNRVFWTRWFKENWHKETLEFIGSHLFQRELKINTNPKIG
jgi:hypothetical protein